MKAVAGLLLLAVGRVWGLASTDTITWGGNNLRSGYEDNHNMDPDIVGSSQFNMLWQTNLPGNYGGQPEAIYSQPLVYTPSGSTTQYVYWATTQNNIYKMNAKTGAIVSSRSLHIPFLQADLDGCTDILPHIGVTGTGVIDADTDTWYITAKTYANQNITTAQGRPNGRYYIHAINVNDLSERPNFPINLEGIVPRNSPNRNFNGGIQLQRPALLHVGNYIYAGFGSHCVQYNFTGWLIGWHKTTGQLVEQWATQGADVPNTVRGGSIWQSGGGLASDDAGSIFFATGNGYASQLATVPVDGHNPPTAMEEAACHMSIQSDGSVQLVDFFMPQNKQELDGADKDLGVTPLVMLPSATFSCGDVRNIGVVTDKFGMTFFLNLDNLGGYRNGPNNGDNVIASYQNEDAVYSGAGVYPLEGGYVYISVVGNPTHAFKFSCNNGQASFTHVGKSNEVSAGIRGVGHGSITSLNGQVNTGLVWVTDSRAPELRVYKTIPAADGSMTLVNSFHIDGVTKFSRPVFGDGIFYVGTVSGYVTAYGAPINKPLNCTSLTDFGAANLNTTTASATITCTAAIGLTAKNLTLNSTSFSISGGPTLPLTMKKGDNFTFKASFSPVTVGSVSADVKIGTTNSVAGYSVISSARLTGTGQSQSALLQLSSNLTWSAVTTGQYAAGINQTFLISNVGLGTLSVVDYQVSDTGADGSFVHGTSTNWFSFYNLPSTISGASSNTVIANFNSATNGNYTAYLRVISNGGTATMMLSAVSGGPPLTLIEFQTTNGSAWVQYVPGQNFTFGNVTENTTKSLKMRITNSGGVGANQLTLTVSKPPFGLSNSIIGVSNNVDLGEGTSLAAGQSKTANVYCSAPKQQWNTNTTHGYATWTINTNDDSFGKQIIGFICDAAAEQAGPLDSNGQGYYRYKGCFKENNPGRQLSKMLYSNASNTNTMCINACAAGGYTFCGTQYNVECWAGNTIPTQMMNDADCNYPCAGNVNQVCGGNGVGADNGGAYISLFANSQVYSGSGSSAVPAGPSVNPGSSGYNFIGCWTEPSNGRALSNVFNLDSTVNTCLATCAGKYTYAGLEYGGECWCGNTLSAQSTLAATTACSMTCNGNSSEYCGNGGKLSLYQMNGTAPVQQTAAAAASSTSSAAAGSFPTGGPYVNPGVAGYASLGCWLEPKNGRAMANQFNVKPQTVANCLNYCAGKYLYAGLEYGGECWCDNVLSSLSTQTTLSSCSSTCNGNSSEYCGNGGMFNLYKYSPPATTSSTSSSTTTVTAVTGVVAGSNSTTTTTGIYYNSTTSTSVVLTTTSTPATTSSSSVVAVTAVVGYNTTTSLIPAISNSSAVSTTGVGYSTTSTSGLVTSNTSVVAVTAIGYNSTSTTVSSLTITLTSISTSATDTGLTSTVTPALTPTSTSTSVISLTSALSTTSTAVLTVASNSTALPANSTTATSWNTTTTVAGVTLVLTSTVTLNSSYSSVPAATTSTLTGLTTTSSSALTSTSSLPVLVLSSTTSTSVLSATSSTPVSSFTSSSVSTSSSSVLSSTSSSVSSSTSSSVSSSTSSSVLSSTSTSIAISTSTVALSSTSTPVAVSTSSLVPTTTSAAVSTSTSTPTSSSTTTTSSSTSVAPSSTSSSTSTTTSTSAAPTRTGPVVNPGMYGFVSLGCYKEPQNGRALDNQLSVKTQTVANCLSICAGTYTYAGLEYGGECWCGNVLRPGANQTVATDCSMTCNNNATEYCGAGLRLNLYAVSAAASSVTAASTSTSVAAVVNAQSTTTSVAAVVATPITSSTSTSVAPKTTGPSINPGVAGYQYIGCYTEPNSGRALRYLQSVKTPTVANCLNLCAGTYAYAGLEYGGECWCDNTLAAGANLTAQTDCSMTCNGNTTEYCGAGLRLTMYQTSSKRLTRI